MSEDNNIYQNRDRLLGEIHSTVKNTEKWCESHDVKDDRRFKEVSRKLTWGAVAIIVVAALTGVIPQLTAFALEHFK